MTSVPGLETATESGGGAGEDQYPAGGCYGEAEAGMREPSGGGTTARHSLEMEPRWSQQHTGHY